MLLDTTKYDGSLHYRFPVEPMYRAAGTLAVYRGPDVVLESYRGKLFAEGHLLNIFYSDHYYNVAIQWNRDWSPLMHYVNVATPAKWDHERVTAIDMDLDVIRVAKDGRILIDDEDEFAEHSVSMGYPSDLISRCRSTADETLALLRTCEGVYSESVFDWRPGTDVASLLG